MKPKSFGLFVTLCMLCMVVFAIHPGQAVATGIKVHVGDTLQYSGAASASYLMYGTSIFVNITNVDTYPVQGTLQYLSVNSNPDPSNPVTPVKDLVPFVVAVLPTWQAGPANSPLASIVPANSPMVTNWTTDNLIFNDTYNDIFADSARNVTTLTFSYNYTITSPSFEIQNIDSVCQYRWDMDTGVLLSYQINITNTEDFALDGYISMTLAKTTVWSLNTSTNIPAFPLEWIAVSSSLIVFALSIQLKKRLQKNMAHGGL